MDILHYPAAIDPTRFSATLAQPDALHGLPGDIKFCSMRVISNQPPNSVVECNHTIKTRKATIHFDEHGVSDTCNTLKTEDGVHPLTVTWAPLAYRLRTGALAYEDALGLWF